MAILAAVVSDPVDGLGILCCLGNNRRIAASLFTGARVKQTRRKRSKENRNFLTDARAGNGRGGKGGEEGWKCGVTEFGWWRFVYALMEGSGQSLWNAWG